MPTKKNILVVGGAGFIGSHITHFLLKQGLNPIVLDNFSTGYPESLPRNINVIHGDMGNETVLKKVFIHYKIDGVMHFGSFIQVNESVQKPLMYYHNNVVKTLKLLQIMMEFKVKYFIFSSSAAVYGEPQYTPIDESHPIKPINPYGQTKQMVEQMLLDFHHAYGLKFSALRYFNAAGADVEGHLIEQHSPETHLIPLVLHAAQDENSAITVYGTDYPTQDGTCVRDYIHVSDLCTAHLLALESLWKGKISSFYNLGTGHGYSVKEVIQTAEKITKRKIKVNEGRRREGDPAILVADAKRAMSELNWNPIHSNLETIIRDAWHAISKSEVMI